MVLVSAYAAEVGAQRIGHTPIAAVASRAASPVAAWTTRAAFAAVAAAHGVDAGAQRIRLAARGGTARARIADAQAPQMGVGPRLAVFARFPIFPRSPVFTRSTVIARGAFSACFGVAGWASIGPIARASISPTSATAFATRCLAQLLSPASWLAVLAGVCCRALTLACAAATAV